MRHIRHVADTEDMSTGNVIYLNLNGDYNLEDVSTAMRIIFK
jgi:hypothetical protein